MLLYEAKETKACKSTTYDDQRLKLVKGQRGKSLLSFNGFLYAKNNQTADAVYWCCRTRTRGLSACKARITTTKKPNGLHRINVTQIEHNHAQTSRILKKLKSLAFSEY